MNPPDGDSPWCLFFWHATIHAFFFGLSLTVAVVAISVPAIIVRATLSYVIGI